VPCLIKISGTVRKLYRFQQAALGSLDELCATAVPETALRAGLPGQEQLRSIKSQQRSASREREKMIQGIQSGAEYPTTGHDSEAAGTAAVFAFGARVFGGKFSPSESVSILSYVE